MRLAEVVGAFAMATDLGLGQPLEHMLRSTVIATRFAEHLGATPAEQEATYWTTLFFTAGCIGVSFELSSVFGDDIGFRADMYAVGSSNLDRLRYIVGKAGGDRPLPSRVKTKAGFLVGGFDKFTRVFLAHCAVSAEMARRLGLGELVVTSLLQTFEQPNGKGIPNGLVDDEILLPIKIANLANVVEARDRAAGWQATCTMAAEMSGIDLSPALVEAWERCAEEILAGVDAESSWDEVVGVSSPGHNVLTIAQLDDALELLADFADLKSPWFTGHSRAVASLAVAATKELGLPESDQTTVRRAGLLHDIGRTGVPNHLWDKPAMLTAAEFEKVRLHAYYTDRVLHRAGRLALLSSIASAAHERHDGTGYPKAAGPTAPLLARVLAAADTYHAMIEDRPHRAALTRDAAATELREEARAGTLDPAAVDAVLAAAGHHVRRTPDAPAGLTPREVEVLGLAARGLTTKTIAASLGIAPKTAGTHIERIYQKIGVSSRAEAAMFAMRHGLVPDWETT